MSLPKLRRRPTPAPTAPHHEHRHLWRLAALRLDYPKARHEPEPTGAPQ